MPEISRTALRTLLTLFLTTFLFLAPAPFQAQASSPGTSKSDQQNLGFYGEVMFEYSDNVFHLTESQKSAMDENDPGNTSSGRFSDMESISDYSVSPALGMTYDFKGLGGEDLRLSARVRYHLYMENHAKSYPGARIRMKNDIGKKSALLLEGNFLFAFFKKNYLTGYDDENENGDIPRNERIYSPAVYDEYEGILSYAHEFYKNKDNTLSQGDLKPFFGYGARSYNSPFHNRSRRIIFGGLALTVEFLNRIDLGVIYRYENVRTPGDDELVLFDETRLENDVNEDGEIAGNAPLVTRIDRSANRHTLEINPSFNLSKDSRIFLGYEKRRSDYTSDNPLDTDHYNNTSYRQKIKACFQYDVSKTWSTEIEYRQTDDKDPEDGDFVENRFTFSIRYDFR